LKSGVLEAVQAVADGDDGMEVVGFYLARDIAATGDQTLSSAK
jgi:hypothetical protein